MGKRLQDLVNESIDMGYITFDKENIGDLSNLNDTKLYIFLSDNPHNIED